MQTIRVLSIEDHWLTIEGLKGSFREERCGIRIDCIKSLEEALIKDENSFDILLLDLILPGLDPHRNVETLQTTFPSKPIIILTGEDRDVWELEMCKAGVKGFLTKNDERSLIKDTIFRVYKGEDLCLQKLPELQKSNPFNAHYLWENDTKEEEKDVLKLFAQDMIIQKIAEKKYVSESAISKVLAKLRKKFKVKTNAALVLSLRKKL